MLTRPKSSPTIQENFGGIHKCWNIANVNSFSSEVSTQENAMKTKSTGYDATGDVRTGRPPLPIDVAKKAGVKKAIGEKHATNQNPGTDGGIIPKKNLSDNAES